jgi:DNA-binding MarR family transcriptional regulator
VSVNFNALHKAFESRIRLGIMSALMVNDHLDFSALKEFLEVTDGNLATHLKALEKEAFVESRKSFIDRKPNTAYRVTAAGRAAFEEHLRILERLIRKDI